MKRWGWLQAASLATLLTSASLVSSGFDLARADDDLVGLYTDPASGDANAAFTEGEIADLIDAYIVMTGVTHELVRGFECAVSFAGDSSVLETRFPVAAANIGSADNIIVGFGMPVIASGGIAHVGTVTFLLASDPEWIFLGPVEPEQSIPGQMAYIYDQSDDIELAAMYSASGDPAEPVFGVNTGGSRPTEDVSWGAVKTLFR